MVLKLLHADRGQRDMNTIYMFTTLNKLYFTRKDASKPELSLNWHSF
jgi:hypothetical protein